MGRNQNKDTNDLILELTAKTKKNFEDLNKIISQQRTNIEKLTKMVEARESKILELEGEVKKLKRDIDIGLHEREMRARNQSIRIFGLKMNRDQTDVGHVLQNVYTKLVSHILNLAVEKGNIAEVPRCHAVLEF